MMRTKLLHARRSTVVLGAVLGLSLTACGADQPSNQKAGVKPRTEPVAERLVSANDSGKAVKLANSEVLTLKLKAQVSTGYAWHVDGIDESVLKLVDRDQVTAPNKGGQDLEVLRFAGVKQGRTRVSLSYRRAMDRNLKGAPGYTLDVDVAGPYAGAFRSAGPYVHQKPDYRVAALPAAYTFCDASTCTPVKDQGQCGSCWAFATVGVAENLVSKASGQVRDFSEQYLVSCNMDGYSCAQGGFQAFDYYINKSLPEEPGAGAVYESDYPYEAMDSACRSPNTHYEKLLSWSALSQWGQVPTVAAMKQALYTNGPLWVGVCADYDFGSYYGGIFYGSYCNQSNHAVVLVGWDDNNGDGYWILRNSWSSSWGEQGYMRISYGANNVGEMASYAVYR